jgi:hypothetical protein
MTPTLTLPPIPVRRLDPAVAAAHPWLEPGELRRCRLRQAARLQVVSGQAWVTRAGGPEDHFLWPGDGLDLDAGADLLVQAEGSEPLRWRWLPPAPTGPRPTGASR